MRLKKRAPIAIGVEARYESRDYRNKKQERAERRDAKAEKREMLATLKVSQFRKV